MANRIQAVVRMKPIEAPINDHHFHWNKIQPRQLIQKSPKDTTETPWTFHHIFSTTDNNKTIFETSVAALLKRALEGYNASVLEYGETNSGKTYTMMGGGGESGIIRQSLQYIEDNKGDRDIFVSCYSVEVYNNKVYDLLPIGLPPDPDHLLPALHISDVNGKPVEIKGVQKYQLESGNDIDRWLNHARVRRSTDKTTQNPESSRSHLIFCIELEIYPHLDEATARPPAVKSKINFGNIHYLKNTFRFCLLVTICFSGSCWIGANRFQ